MESVTAQKLQDFFHRLGERASQPLTLSLLGGSALCLLGSPRETLDVDYFAEGLTPELTEMLAGLAAELKLDLEFVPLAEFIPLPPEAEGRRRPVGRFGSVEVYLFDLYSIALSKVARGFESDLEDVLYLLRQKLIDWPTLATHFHSIFPRARSADIVPGEFQQYFDTLQHLAAGEGLL